jgi:hypothetical protein
MIPLLGLVLFYAFSFGCPMRDDGENHHDLVIPPVCGDGRIESNRYGREECEGIHLAGHTCVTLGWEGGVLACNDRCRFDTSACTGPHPCGNGVIDYGEHCDGDNLNWMTCASLRPGFYIAGELACTRDCYYWDYNCMPYISCGNGVREDPEMCDDGNQNSNTEPDACRKQCYSAWCGDGVLDTGEECDEGMEISDIHPDACRRDCKWAHCGDNVKDSNEDCDGPDLGLQTCESLGYSGGTLRCTPDCVYDASACTT